MKNPRKRRALIESFYPRIARLVRNGKYFSNESCIEILEILKRYSYSSHAKKLHSLWIRHKRKFINPYKLTLDKARGFAEEGYLAVTNSVICSNIPDNVIKKSSFLRKEIAEIMQLAYARGMHKTLKSATDFALEGNSFVADQCCSFAITCSKELGVDISSDIEKVKSLL